VIGITFVAASVSAITVQTNSPRYTRDLPDERE
jgi:hypothetical protein